jgi:hypothetical protein
MGNLLGMSPKLAADCTAVQLLTNGSGRVTLATDSAVCANHEFRRWHDDTGY